MIYRKRVLSDCWTGIGCKKRRKRCWHLSGVWRLNWRWEMASTKNSESSYGSYLGSCFFSPVDSGTPQGNFNKKGDIKFTFWKNLFFGKIWRTVLDGRSMWGGRYWEQAGANILNQRWPVTTKRQWEIQDIIVGFI